jgi:hypothetical protein
VAEPDTRARERRVRFRFDVSERVRACRAVDWASEPCRVCRVRRVPVAASAASRGRSQSEPQLRAVVGLVDSRRAPKRREAGDCGDVDSPLLMPRALPRPPAPRKVRATLLARAPRRSFPRGALRRRRGARRAAVKFRRVEARAAFAARPDPLDPPGSPRSGRGAMRRCRQPSRGPERSSGPLFLRPDRWVKDFRLFSDA